MRSGGAQSTGNGGDILRARLSPELGAEVDGLMTRWTVLNRKKVCATVEGDDKVVASHC